MPLWVALGRSWDHLGLSLGSLGHPLGRNRHPFGFQECPFPSHWVFWKLFASFLLLFLRFQACSWFSQLFYACSVRLDLLVIAARCLPLLIAAGGCLSLPIVGGLVVRVLCKQHVMEFRCFPDGFNSLIRVCFASLATWSRPRTARPEDHNSLNAALAYPFHSLCTRISKSRMRS